MVKRYVTAKEKAERKEKILRTSFLSKDQMIEALEAENEELIVKCEANVIALSLAEKHTKLLKEENKKLLDIIIKISQSPAFNFLGRELCKEVEELFEKHRDVDN